MFKSRPHHGGRNDSKLLKHEYKKGVLHPHPDFECDLAMDATVG